MLANTFRAVSVSFVLLRLLQAQGFRSTVSGRVTDMQGAVLPNATVRATQVATGAASSTKTGAEGEYTLPFLTPGVYRVSAEAPGFKKHVRDGIRVETNERQQLDIRMDVGEVTESVTVSANTSMLETATSSTGQVITSRTIENIPLSGRTPLVLAQLAYGVIPTSDPRFVRPFDNAGPSNFSIGGAPNRSNELLLDGAPNSFGSQNGRVAFNPPMDAVVEVKVETFQSDAAYGHTGGGTVNIITKAGTNDYHGTASWFNQTSRLFATPFFANRKSNVRFNQYGVNVGGPIRIPRLYDGRNKLFFFYAWEGLKDYQQGPGFSTVPTLRMREGDFSELLALGSAYQLFDSATGVVEGSTVRRQPFPGNIIPPSRLNPIALQYNRRFYDAPNVNRTRENLEADISGERNAFNSHMARMDLNLSERHKVFGTARYNLRDSPGLNPLGRAQTDITARNGGGRENIGVTLDDVYTFTPTMLLNTRLSWTRFVDFATNNTSRPFNLRDIGFSPRFAAQARDAILPRVSFDSGSVTGVGDGSGTFIPDDVFQIFSNLNKVAGKHDLKIGGDLRHYRQSIINPGFAAGTLSFSSDWTRGPLYTNAPAPYGQDYAAFLLGLPSSGQLDVNAAQRNDSRYFAVFLNDNWRVASSLTLNLGIRYERNLGTTEQYNRTTNGFAASASSPVEDAARAAYRRSPIPEIAAANFRVPGGLTFADPANRSVYNTGGKFSPRAGFAWTPAALGGKTVFRGGLGLFVFPIGTVGVNQWGFSQVNLLVPTLDGFLTPTASLTDPFPGGTLEPVGSAAGLSTFLGRPIRFMNPNPVNPYSLRWHFGIQRELARNLVVEIGYQGNRGYLLNIDRETNFVPRDQLSTSLTRDQPNISRLTGNVPNPFAGLLPGTPLNGTVVQRQQLLRPFPQFSSVVQQWMPEGSSSFHMLQMRVERRYGNGLTLLGNYLFSKLIEQRTFLNEADPLPERRIAAEDRPHRIVVSGSYDLPFLRNQRGGLARVLGGWNFNAIYTWQVGAPLNWSGTNPIYFGGPLNLDPRRVDGVAFDVTQFNRLGAEQPALNLRRFSSQFGNLRQDGANNFDMSLLKNTRLGEHLNAQFRFEAFNALNHPTFNGPNLNVTNVNFGRILSQQNQPRRIQMGLRLVW